MPGKQESPPPEHSSFGGGDSCIKTHPSKKKKETADEVPAGRARKKCARCVANLKPI